MTKIKVELELDFIEELRNAYTEIQFQQEILGQFVEEVDMPCYCDKFL